MVNINDRSKEAIAYYLDTNNACEYTENAGINKSNANKDEVKYNNKEMANITKYGDLDDDKNPYLDEVTSYLFRVMRGDEKEIELVRSKDDKGNNTTSIEKPMSGALRMKAAELLCKKYGLSKDKDINEACPVVISEDI